MTTHTTPRTVDAVVIGAGFGGIYAVHKLHNELGLTTVGFDKADGPGGTWYWNRYPGALSDTESHLYRYSFDRDLLQDGTWKNTYITQPEILEYLESVVDRFDLRRHFRFGTAVTSAIYSDDEGQWEVTTDDGARVSRHLRHQRRRTALRHQLPEPARSGVRSRARPSTPPPGPRARTSPAAASASSAPVRPASR